MYLLAMFIAFFVTLFCIACLKPLALRLGLVDAPSNRKRHEGKIPLIGGLAMFIGFLAALLTLPISLQHYRSLIAAASLLIFTGILDDFHELSPNSRFLAQIVALLLMFFWGQIKLIQLGDLLFYKPIILGRSSLIVTLIAGLGVINAINMMDGVDGLAGSLALNILGYLFYCGYLLNRVETYAILIIVNASVIAFLSLNFRWSQHSSAQVFMGDAGSMFLGFILVWFFIELSQTGTQTITPVTMLWLIALPLFDTTTVMVHRLIRKKSIFSSDRAHFHHILSDLNFSPAKISVLISGINFLLGGMGLLAFQYHVLECIVFGSFLFSFGLYFVIVNYLRKQLYNRQENKMLFKSASF